MSTRKSPIGFLVGALLLGVFWGLLSQCDNQSEEVTATVEKPNVVQPVVPQYSPNPSQSLCSVLGE